MYDLDSQGAVYSVASMPIIFFFSLIIALLFAIYVNLRMIERHLRIIVDTKNKA